MLLSLSSEIERWQLWASVGEILVILGIVAEAVELGFNVFASENKRRDHFLVGISIIILIGGLGLERLATGNVNRLAALQTVEQQREIAVANLQASQANKSAANAGGVAAKANERTESLKLAGEAQREALREKMVRAEKALSELQERLKERHLTDGQKTVISDILSTDPNRGRLVIEVNSTSSEAHRFAEELRAILEKSGWKVADFESAFVSTGFKGLAIGAHDKADDPVRVATLQRALKEAGFEALAYELTRVPKGTLQLIVGEKP